jgi:exosortase
MSTVAAKERAPLDSELVRSWPLVVGFGALALPTLWRLAQQTWSREDGAQGPLILALGLWLLWREWSDLKAGHRGGGTALAVGMIAFAMVSYVAGRMFDYMTLEAGGLYVAGVAMLYARIGAAGLRKAWFPLLFLAFAVPPPGFVIDDITAPLKHLAASLSTGIVAAIGLPVAREGVTIMVAQYQLLVEDACSGMNSLVGLTAISLLYIYLRRRASPPYALLLAAFVIPIAIAANVVRIITLILITYGFGDEVAQSFIHMAAGLLLFGTALVLVFALDGALYPFVERLRKAR